MLLAALLQLAGGSTSAAGEVGFEVDFTQLLGLADVSGQVLHAVVHIKPDETVYTAATRVCSSQNALAQNQQADCVIPLAKWLQQRSANDGHWKLPHGEGNRQEAESVGMSGSNNWLLELPRDSTRMLSATISRNPHATPLMGPLFGSVTQASQYGFEKRRCPPLSNRSLQLFLQSGPFSENAGVAALQGLGYFSGTDDRAWGARVALHHRQLQRQLIAATEYPSRLAGNVFFQLHYEPTFSCVLEERIGPIMDGGKWVCDPPALQRIDDRQRQQGQDRCLVYSVGSDKDTLFERDMVST